MAMALLVCAPCFAKGRINKDQLDYLRGHPVFYKFIPQKEGPMPLVVVLLHGSLRNGWVMADLWKSSAEHAGFMIAAPDSSDPCGWTPRADPAELFHAIVKRMSAEHAV